MTLGTNPEETVLAGTGGLYYAPLGTAFPASIDDPIDGEDWTGTGFTEDDGVTFKISPEVKEFFSWQSEDAVRRKRKRSVKSIETKLQQINRANVVLCLGGSVEGSDGDWTYWPPDESDDDASEWAFIVEIQDGDRVDRFCVFRGTADADVEMVFNAEELTTLPVEVSFLAPGDYADVDHPGLAWFWQSNSDAFDASEGDT